MKLKNEKEIGFMACEYADQSQKNRTQIAWVLFDVKEACKKCYTQAQQDLLASASESFEEWWENDKDMTDIIGRASERVAGITDMAQRCSILSEFWAQEAWQAATLVNEKKYQERINDARKDILYLIGVLITYPVLIESKDNMGSLHQNIKEFIEKWELNK